MTVELTDKLLKSLMQKQAMKRTKTRDSLRGFAFVEAAPRTYWIWKLCYRFGCVQRKLHIEALRKTASACPFFSSKARGVRANMFIKAPWLIVRPNRSRNACYSRS